MNLPADDYILLSLLNTKLRDEYSSLQELCEAEAWDMSEITSRTAALGYEYDAARNCFSIQ